MKDIVIIGAISFGKEVVALLEDNNSVHKEWNILGFVDDYLEVGSSFFGYPILGTVDWLIAQSESISAVIGIGSLEFREALVHRLDAAEHKISFPPIISHRATILSPKTVEIEEGVVVCAGSILTVDIQVRRFALVNLQVSLTHDVEVGELASLSPHCSLSGRVKVGKCATIGTGAVVIPNKKIGDYAVLGAGSVAFRNIPNDCTAVGNPARVILKRDRIESE